LFVIPVKAGIQGCKSAPVALDPSPDLIRGFRRGDEVSPIALLKITCLDPGEGLP